MLSACNLLKQKHESELMCLGPALLPCVELQLGRCLASGQVVMGIT